MIKKAMVIVLAGIMVFGLAATAMAFIGSNITWDEKYADGAALVQGTEHPTRNNSSGDSIPSNSHSARFPGLYFTWAGNGNNVKSFLLVDESVFGRFEDEVFSITLQHSSRYFEYQIVKSEGTPHDGGIYAYEIDRNVQYLHNNGKLTMDQLKSVNQAFIEGFYNEAKVEIVKEWLLPDGNEVNEDVQFTNGFARGANTVDVDSWDSSRVVFSEREDLLDGYKFDNAVVYQIVNGERVEITRTSENNISFTVIGGGVYEVAVTNSPKYYTVNYWNTDEFGAVRGLWHTEQVRHGEDAIGRVDALGRPVNPTLRGYNFAAWVDEADLKNVKSDRDVYATWSFNEDDDFWKITSNAHSDKWEPIGITCVFADQKNDGVGYIGFAEDFFKKYESVTIRFKDKGEETDTTYSGEEDYYDLSWYGGGMATIVNLVVNK